jgi:acyl-CoA thioesterase FadM
MTEVGEKLPTRRDEFRVLRTITTRWMDNDHYGHVNNVVYYSYFDTAVNGYLIEASGIDVRELPAIGIVAETSCRFLRELSFPETVHAGLALEKLGSSSVVYRIGLRTPSPRRWDGSCMSTWTARPAGRCRSRRRSARRSPPCPRATPGSRPYLEVIGT